MLMTMTGSSRSAPRPTPTSLPTSNLSEANEIDKTTGGISELMKEISSNSNSIIHPEEGINTIVRGLGILNFESNLAIFRWFSSRLLLLFHSKLDTATTGRRTTTLSPARRPRSRLGRKWDPVRDAWQSRTWRSRRPSSPSSRWRPRRPWTATSSPTAGQLQQELLPPVNA